MRSGQNPNIDDDTRARARRFVADAGMPKPAVTANPGAKKAPVVTKKMLADSGFDNLRDYLNAQRGLTRRGMSKAEAEKQLELGKKPSADAVAKAKSRLGMDDSSGMDPEARTRNYVRRDMKDRMDVVDRETQGDFLRAMPNKPRRTPEPLSSTRKPGTNVNYENESSDMKRGGKVKGYAKGGMTASKRADGCAVRGRTRA
jgi:hypothetical protein